MEDNQLSIEIKTQTDLSGLMKASDGLDKVAASASKTSEAVRNAGDATGKANDKLASSTQAAGNEIKRLGSDFREGAEAGRVLADVATGNIAALSRMGFAIKTVGTLMKTSIVGTLLTLGSVAAQVLVPMIKGFDDAKKKMEESAKAAKELDAVKLESFRQQLVGIDLAADEAKRKLQLLREEQAAVDDAQKAFEIARIKADPGRSEESKTRDIATIESTFSSRAKDRNRASLEDEVKFSSQRIEDVQTAAGPQLKEFHQALAQQNELRQQLAKKSELENELFELGKITNSATFRQGFYPGAENVKQRKNELADELRSQRFPTEDEVKAADDRVSETYKVAVSINDQIDKLRSELKAAQDKLKSSLNTEAKVAPIEAKTKALQQLGDIQEAKKRDAATRSAAGRVSSLETEYSLINAEAFGKPPSEETQALLAAKERELGEARSALSAFSQASSEYHKVIVGGMKSLAEQQKQSARDHEKLQRQFENGREL